MRNNEPSATNTTISINLNGKQHRDPNKLWASPISDHQAGMKYNTIQNNHFTQRVMTKARSEIALAESTSEYNGDNGDNGEIESGSFTMGSVDEQSETIHRGLSLPQIGRSPGNTKNNTTRSVRLGYKPSSMLQRLELVGDIAAEEVSPSKMARRRRIPRLSSNDMTNRSDIPSKSALLAAASAEVDASFAEQQRQQQQHQPTQKTKSYRQLALDRRSERRSRKGGNNKSLRQMYGV